jgi:hypothetical protein
MITRQQAAILLTRCAANDQRSIGEADVEAWVEAAEDHRWTFDVAYRVIREHYSAGAGRPRIDPAQITDRIRALRGQAAESFEAPRIPDGLPNHEYPTWLRARLSRHVDALLERWAATGEDPRRPGTPPRVLNGSLRAVAAAAPAEVRSKITEGVERMLGRRVEEAS